MPLLTVAFVVGTLCLIFSVTGNGLEEAAERWDEQHMIDRMADAHRRGRAKSRGRYSRSGI